MKIFLVVEKQFREHIGDDTRKIEIKSMVLTFLRNCQILSDFLTICGKSDIEIVDKEIAKNLLESLSSCSNIQICFSQEGGLQTGIQKEEVEITANFHQKSIKRS